MSELDSEDNRKPLNDERQPVNERIWSLQFPRPDWQTKDRLVSRGWTGNEDQDRGALHVTLAAGHFQVRRAGCGLGSGKVGPPANGNDQGGGWYCSSWYDVVAEELQKLLRQALFM